MAPMAHVLSPDGSRCACRDGATCRHLERLRAAPAEDCPGFPGIRNGPVALDDGGHIVGHVGMCGSTGYIGTQGPTPGETAATRDHCRRCHKHLARCNCR